MCDDFEDDDSDCGGCILSEEDLRLVVRKISESVDRDILGGLYPEPYTYAAPLTVPAATLEDIREAAKLLKQQDEPSPLSMREPMMIYASPSITKDQAEEASELVGKNRWDRRAPRAEPSIHLEPGTVIFVETKTKLEDIQPISFSDRDLRFIESMNYFADKYFSQFSIPPELFELPFSVFTDNASCPPVRRRYAIKRRRDGHLHRQRRRP